MRFPQGELLVLSRSWTTDSSRRIPLLCFGKRAWILAAPAAYRVITETMADSDTEIAIKTASRA